MKGPKRKTAAFSATRSEEREAGILSLVPGRSSENIMKNESKILFSEVVGERILG